MWAGFLKATESLQRRRGGGGGPGETGVGGSGGGRRLSCAPRPQTGQRTSPLSYACLWCPTACWKAIPISPQSYLLWDSKTDTNRKPRHPVQSWALSFCSNSTAALKWTFSQNESSLTASAVLTERKRTRRTCRRIGPCTGKVDRALKTSLPKKAVFWKHEGINSIENPLDSKFSCRFFISRLNNRYTFIFKHRVDPNFIDELFPRKGSCYNTPRPTPHLLQHQNSYSRSTLVIAFPVA